ncbi:MAG: YqgE/AlgH family protein, partial [Alphaproteobacteria bacterium]
MAVALLVAGRAAAGRPPGLASLRSESAPRAVGTEKPAPGPRATEAGRGSLLVADPSLGRGSSPFAETVVLVLEHRAAGAIGIVLNQPGKAKLSDFDRTLSDLESGDGAVYEGGPLERERLVLVVQAPEAPRDSLRIVDEVWVTGSIDAVRDLVRAGGRDARFRAFAGRATWGPGQLDEEIRRGAWLVAPADASSVFTPDPARLWRKLVDRLSARWVRGIPGPQPSAAWAAASRAIGTRNGEHET